MIDIDGLTREERLDLLERLWDSLSSDPEAMPLTDAQRRELERRLAAHAATPNDVVPWEEVKARALARARK